MGVSKCPYAGIRRISSDFSNDPKCLCLRFLSSGLSSDTHSVSILSFVSSLSPPLLLSLAASAKEKAAKEAQKKDSSSAANKDKKKDGKDKTDAGPVEPKEKVTRSAAAGIPLSSSTLSPLPLSLCHYQPSLRLLLPRVR